MKISIEILEDKYDSKQYDKNLNHRKNNEIPYLSSSKTRIFVVEHWMGMPKAEHQRRVNKIVKNTILGDYLAGILCYVKIIGVWIAIMNIIRLN